MSQLKQAETELFDELDRDEQAADSLEMTEQEADNEEAPEEIYYSEYRRKRRVLPFLKAMVVVIFILGFITACLIKTGSLYKEKAELIELRDGLEQQINVEKAKALDYKVDKAYYNSDKYKEDMARNRFRLVYPGEYMISLIE